MFSGFHKDQRFYNLLSQFLKHKSFFHNKIKSLTNIDILFPPPKKSLSINKNVIRLFHKNSFKLEQKSECNLHIEE